MCSHKILYFILLQSFVGRRRFRAIDEKILIGIGNVLKSDSFSDK